MIVSAFLQFRFKMFPLLDPVKLSVSKKCNSIYGHFNYTSGWKHNKTVSGYTFRKINFSFRNDCYGLKPRYSKFFWFVVFDSYAFESVTGFCNYELLFEISISIADKLTFFNAQAKLSGIWLGSNHYKPVSAPQITRRHFNKAFNQPQAHGLVGIHWLNMALQFRENSAYIWRWRSKNVLMVNLGLFMLLFAQY